MTDSHAPPARTPRPPPPAFGTSQRHLARLLAQARRRRLLLRAVCFAGAGVSFGCLATLSAAALLTLQPSAAARLILLGLLVAVVLAAPLAGFLTGCRASDVALARQITAHDPRLRSLLLSAVQLREHPAEGQGLSQALVRAQADFALAHLGDLDLAKALPSRLARWLLGTGVFSLLLVGALWRDGPALLRRGFAALKAQPAASTAAAQRDPITGDIELRFLYPVHTHLPPRSLSGTSGEIEAPAGTHIELRTRADRPVQAASLILNGTAVPLLVTGDRQLSGGFTVTQAGSYFFRFGPAAQPEAQGPPIPVAVIADAPPQVTLENPAETVEVDPHQVLDLRYHASDDYGLSQVRLVYRLPGAQQEQAVSLHTPVESPLRIDGSARFDLGPLKLMAGDELTYAVEALDNDSVLGPKAGRSAPRTLKVFSEAEHHREALARARALWERLLAVLGDRLDELAPGAPPPPSGGDERALALCQDMNREARVLFKDKSQATSLAPALRNVAQGERRRASATTDVRETQQAEGTTAAGVGAAGGRAGSALAAALKRTLAEERDGLERDVLYLEALLDQATGQDLAALTRELSARRRELADLVERYRKSPTAELKAQILAQLRRLKARTAELMARMQELAKGLSDQHLNREAMAAIRKNKDVGTQLSQVEHALDSGDVEGALKSLDQLAAALDAMQQRLDRSSSEGQDTYPELKQKLADFKGRLDRVQTQQARLAKDTEALQQEVRKTLEQRAPVSSKLLGKLRALVARAQGELNLVPEVGLPRGLLGDDSLPEAKQRTGDLDHALQSKDLEQALRSSELALRAVGSLQAQSERESLFDAFGGHGFPPDEQPAPPAAIRAAKTHLETADPLLRSVHEQLQKLFPDEKSLLSPKQKQQLGQLQQQQRKAGEETQKLSQQLQQISREAPVFDPSAEESLGLAGDRMREAAQRLSEHEPGAASQQEQGALEQLQRLSQAMAHGKGSAPGGGLPNPFSTSQPTGDGDSDGAPESAEHEKVVVPGADQYQVPAEFRRDILDAMKQKAPKSFEDQVKRYYQEIVK